MRALSLVALLAAVAPASAGGSYFAVSYPPSDRPGELRFGVTYTLWLPAGVRHVRGVIVHQHGCGAGACKGGETAAYDLHWQALAEKWDCALLGPSYRQPDDQNCRLWCDPRNGSDRAFRTALRELAAKSGHPEVEAAPWCLWGHSGGGFWASLMLVRYPDRVAAVWCRSGTAFPAWERGEVPKPEVPQAAYRVPVMLNPGAKENGDKRFNGAWTGSLAMFKAFRAVGAPVGFAPDPRTSHECGGSRYLAIPFFDACLAARLPAPGAKEPALKPIDPAGGWRAPLLGDAAVPVAKYTGKAEDAVWLPDERVATAWAEYVKAGAVSDATPPPAPTGLKVTPRPDGTVELTWNAGADLESGLRGFVIERDGVEVARLPEKPAGQPRPLFQGLSYHDTPTAPVPALRYVDKPPAGATPKYRVVAVNGAGLRSAPTAAR